MWLQDDERPNNSLLFIGGNTHYLILCMPLCWNQHALITWWTTKYYLETSLVVWFCIILWHDLVKQLCFGSWYYSIYCRIRIWPVPQSNFIICCIMPSSCFFPCYVALLDLPDVKKVPTKKLKYQLLVFVFSSISCLLHFQVLSSWHCFQLTPCMPVAFCSHYSLCTSTWNSLKISIQFTQVSDFVILNKSSFALEMLSLMYPLVEFSAFVFNFNFIMFLRQN